MVSVFWEYKRETRDARERFKSYLNTFGENRVAHQELLEWLSIDEGRVCLGRDRIHVITHLQELFCVPRVTAKAEM